jgi:hypothetical protein
MAEIRINTTGGVKLYDADDSHYAQIIAGTITSNVNAITLGHDVVSIVDNLALTSDSAVLKFGADNDTTLTHTDGTGLTLNSTNKLCFNDASQFVQGSSATVLSIGATDEIDLTATAVDLNGTLNVSGVATFQATPVFPDGSLALADLDIDGGTDIGADLVDADEIIVDDGGGGTNRRCDMSRVKTYVGGITAANFRPNAKAIIINGDMKINQRGTVTDITTNTYTLDRWLTEGDDCTLTVSKDTDVPTGEGFSNSLKMDVTTANGSVSAGDLQMISTRLEGQDVQLFKKGTASAETFTLAFWVKNSITGTFIAFLQDDDNSRECSQTFTVSSADTWEKKVVNFPADTTGAFTNDNGRSLRIKIYLDAGSDWTSGSLQTSWGSGSNTTRAGGITTGWTTSDSNNFWITGVQLEVGTYTSSTIPPFQHESYADNLRRCQRYYTVWLGAGGTGSGSYNACAEASGTTSVANINFFTPVPLRAAPTINNPVMGYFDYNTATAGTSGGTVTVRGAGEGGMSNILFNATGAANLTDATLVTCRAYADLTMDAEL